MTVSKHGDGVSIAAADRQRYNCQQTGRQTNGRMPVVALIVDSKYNRCTRVIKTSGSRRRWRQQLLQLSFDGR